MIFGISAGSMNSAEEVYAQPELEGESLDPNYVRFIPGLGLNSYVLVLAFAIIGYAIADIIFFPIYYKNGKSIVMSTLFTILGFVVYIGVVTIGLPFIPGLGILNNLHIGIQFAILAGAIALSFLLHIFVYKCMTRKQ